MDAFVAAEEAEARLAAIRSEEARLEAEIAAIAEEADAMNSSAVELLSSVISSGVPVSVSAPFEPQSPTSVAARARDPATEAVVSAAVDLVRAGSATPEPELAALELPVSGETPTPELRSPLERERNAALRNPNSLELLRMNCGPYDGSPRPSHLTTTVVSPNAAACQPRLSP